MKNCTPNRRPYCLMTGIHVFDDLCLRTGIVVDTDVVDEAIEAICSTCISSSSNSKFICIVKDSARIGDRCCVTATIQIDTQVGTIVNSREVIPGTGAKCGTASYRRCGSAVV